MDDGLLSLKWNNHKNTFFEILKSLREKANYTDATLAVEGKFYHVHKLVLSTCSEYFNEIFEQTPCKSPVIVLKDVRYQDLESLLDYMYLGEVNVKQNDLALLLKTAECLRIKGLAVPDEDSNLHSTSPCNEARAQDSNVTPQTPPAKRRKEDTHPTPSSPIRIPPIPVSSSIYSPGNQLGKGIIDDHDTVDQPIDSTAIKVEMDNYPDEEEEDAFQSDEKNRESFLSKSEQEGDSFSNNSFGPSTHNDDMVWDDSEKFPQESSMDDPTNSQNAGDGEDDEEVDVTSVSNNSQLNYLSLSQTKEARRCQLCQVMLANSNLLRRHVEDHHFHIRKYDCVHCGKKFKRKEHRERHERIHTGEKPFACPICPSKFTQKEHLKGHIENVHNKHRDKETSVSLLDAMNSEIDGGGERSSSPPSLASPMSISSMMNTSMANVFPSSFSLGQYVPPAYSPPSILPTTTHEDKNITALYAPVNRKNANSPNKQVQTITINFN